MRHLWRLITKSPPPADEKAALEAKRRELDERSEANRERLRLAEIQVNAIARRTDTND